MSEIPIIIKQMIEQLHDENQPFWLRNNIYITLQSVVDKCQTHIVKFESEAIKRKRERK